MLYTMIHIARAYYNAKLNFAKLTMAKAKHASRNFPHHFHFVATIYIFFICKFSGNKSNVGAGCMGEEK